jgi:hypothetical protein
MVAARGENYWFIPDGYIPEKSSGDLTSHESVCVLNCSSDEALIQFTIYFEDRDSIENILVVVPPRRTKHIRTSSLLKDGAQIPAGIPYAIEVLSDIPVIVQ